MSAPSVLFVCGRNAIRSPMGEGLWRLEHGERANARSCGVIPAAFVDGYTISVMEELDCDLSEFSPIALSGVGEPAAEIVVSLSTAADRTAREYAERTGATFLAWPIADPSETPGDREAKLAAYRQTRDEIREHIRSFQPA